MTLLAVTVIGLPFVLAYWFYKTSMVSGRDRWVDYFAVLTDQRLILQATKLKLGKRTMLWVEEIPRQNIRGVAVGGFANNRSITFQLTDGEDTFRLAVFPERVRGQGAFLKDVPAALGLPAGA